MTLHANMAMPDLQRYPWYKVLTLNRLGGGVSAPPCSLCVLALSFLTSPWNFVTFNEKWFKGFFYRVGYSHRARRKKSGLWKKNPKIAYNIFVTKATDLKAIFLKNACHTLIFVLKKIIHAFKNDRFYKKFVFF